ncbi:hypothetical protein EMIT0P291_360032 [Pseudomonas sp. IT-P291]
MEVCCMGSYWPFSAYSHRQILLAASGQRWRQHGASPDEVKVKLGKILQGADPPHSEAAVQKFLYDAGFGDATRFFSSLLLTSPGADPLFFVPPATFATIGVELKSGAHLQGISSHVQLACHTEHRSPIA